MISILQVAVSPLLGQIENMSAQQWITSIAITIAGAMMFNALKGIETKLNAILKELSELKTTTAVLETRVSHLEDEE